MRCDVPTGVLSVRNSSTYAGDADPPADGSDSKDNSPQEDGNSQDSYGSGQTNEGATGTQEDLPLAVPAIAFLYQEGPVLVCAVSSDGRRVVTGGCGDRALVWNLDTGKLAFDCAVHRDETTCAGFNHDSTLLCTCGGTGTVRVWSMRVYQVVCTFTTVTLVGWVKWSRDDNVLLTGTVDGLLWMWQVLDGQCKTMQGSFTECSVGRSLADGRRAAAACEDGSVCIRDLHKVHLFHGMTGPSRMHANLVLCLDVGREIVVTAADEVQVMKASTGKQLLTIRPVEETAAVTHDDYVSALDLDYRQRMLVMGTNIGDLVLWDFNCAVQKQSFQYPSAATRAVWKRPHTELTACKDGFVREWDVRIGNHDSAAVLEVFLNPDCLLGPVPRRTLLCGQCIAGTCAVYRFASPDRYA
ncbi:hypothetical protein HPB48_015968 [Haemaphysalis longicornis]|uniref:Uncharacterized protein n=1 Tax=Haemaphysalis longicornis TaxID=44386 RepID=A0A9J6G567_HAELO|nr:hypothetical protein HPB48_015968 [Haemaphysalis longicornis]